MKAVIFFICFGLVLFGFGLGIMVKFDSYHHGLLFAGLGVGIAIASFTVGDEIRKSEEKDEG